MNQSIHSIDLLQWLIGRVKSVYAYMDKLVHIELIVGIYESARTHKEVILS